MNIKSLFRRKSIVAVLENNEHQDGHSLAKNLSVIDLTSFGIAAIIGAGIFSTIGKASADGGAAVMFLFVFTAIACGFSAMCYAEFASVVPVSGSAYTYAYTTFGELVAWIIGWDLIMEYAVGNIVVAISWSDYFTTLLKGLHINLPAWLCTDFSSASAIHAEVTQLLAQGQTLDMLTPKQIEGYEAWQYAPTLNLFGGLHLVLDLPALLITILITYLVYIGIKESKTTSNLLVLFKLVVIVLVVIVGAMYVQPQNWSPFAPNGIEGVMKGVSAVFFAYIGFDAISTTAEECKNPKKDLPIAMFTSLAICTVLYILISLILTGMVSYKELAVGDPLAYVFGRVGLTFVEGVIAFSAVVAMASVLLVFQMGQPRIWMTMSRDGLLPKKFSQIHPKHQTPAFSTIITGFAVGIPALFVNLELVTDLTSIGTLFAFMAVCGGVLVMQNTPNMKNLARESRFKVPYINARFIVPLLMVSIVFGICAYDLNIITDFFRYDSWKVFKDKIPVFGFLIAACVLTYYSAEKQLSLIPVLGMLCNLYLMTKLGFNNWMGFLCWLLVGLVIYFTYSYQNSKLNKS
jgi:basic amino acid/polyamine antiporter, APA family